MSLLNETSGAPDDKEAKGNSKLPLLSLGILIALGLVALVGIGSLILNRLNELESQMLGVGKRVEEIGESSESALERALEAEEAALQAARGRSEAETDAAMARDEAERAREAAQRARQDAKVALAEAERIKKEREDELNRLQEALNQIAETRRTALGLVMNLGSDHMKFDFDKSDLRPENRELLSRIVGILLTSKDYQIYVYGHTDNIGTEEYNMDLSERRAQSVRDYLAEAGINPGIISTEGFGKSQPLVPGTSDEARAKNRRVELGIVNTKIKYPGQASTKGN
jgi:outer membrane protein OmpA-like peptidoglycan-associated protein